MVVLRLQRQLIKLKLLLLNFDFEHLLLRSLKCSKQLNELSVVVVIAVVLIPEYLGLLYQLCSQLLRYGFHNFVAESELGKLAQFFVPERKVIVKFQPQHNRVLTRLQVQELAQELLRRNFAVVLFVLL